MTPPKVTQRQTELKAAFSLVELLVVLGVLAILISILLPALSRSRASAYSVACQSNLRQLGIILQGYVNDNSGWLFPVGPDDILGRPTTLGTNLPPHLRWPMKVVGFELGAPDPLPYKAEEYVRTVYDPIKYPTSMFTPKVLLCPSDVEPVEAHTYVLNQHLADKRIRFGAKGFVGMKASEVVVAGEKRADVRDYYMERADYERVVDLFRHSVKVGSNYLFFDGSVSSLVPSDANKGLDPWDPPGKEPGLDIH